MARNGTGSIKRAHVLILSHRNGAETARASGSIATFQPSAFFLMYDGVGAGARLHSSAQCAKVPGRFVARNPLALVPKFRPVIWQRGERKRETTIDVAEFGQERTLQLASSSSRRRRRNGRACLSAHSWGRARCASGTR